MTLKELGREYLEGEKLLRAKITELRAKLEETVGTRDRENLTARINALYAEALEAHRTGTFLCEYYEGDGR